MIYKEMPPDFNSRFDIVSCFVEYNGEILLLHRQDLKPQGNTWGVPAGKVEGVEEVLDRMIIELREEAGFQSPPQLSYFGKVYVRYPTYDFVYHIFHTKLDQEHTVVINRIEHKDHKWIAPEHALNMDLIPDLDACIKLFYELN